MTGKEFGRELSAMVREHVERKLAPLEARIAELEARTTKGGKARVRITTEGWQRAAPYPGKGKE